MLLAKNNAGKCESRKLILSLRLKLKEICLQRHTHEMEGKKTNRVVFDVIEFC